MTRKNIIKYLFIIDILLIYGFLASLGYQKANTWRKEKSKEMLSQSQKTSNEKERVLFLEKASLLEPNEETYLLTGLALLENGNEASANNYLKKVRTQEGYFQLATSYYRMGNSEQSIKNLNKSLSIKRTSDAYILLGKNYLRLNQANKADECFRNALSLENNNEDAKQYIALLAYVKGQQYNQLDIKEVYSLDSLTMLNQAYSFLYTQGYPQFAFSFLEEKGKLNSLNRDGYLLLSERYIETGEYDNAYSSLLKAKQLDRYYPHTYKQLVIVCEKLGKNQEEEIYQKFISAIEW